MRQLSDIIYDQGPLTLPPSSPVQEACQKMHHRRVGSVLVTDPDGCLLGIFTGRDAVGRVLAAGLNAAETLLADVMTPNPTTMPPHKTAIDALRLMWDGGFRHIPVVADGKVVGVVSRGDFKGDEHGRGTPIVGEHALIGVSCSAFSGTESDRAPQSRNSRLCHQDFLRLYLRKFEATGQ